MEYLPEGMAVQQATILCCQCGTPIEPNAANMCVACVRTQVDISEGIPKQGTLYFCKGCERYLQPPGQWIMCALESRELLALCLKKLKGLNRVRLVDAGFAWTEPHSKRIKLKLTIQKEVVTLSFKTQNKTSRGADAYPCSICRAQVCPKKTPSLLLSIAKKQEVLGGAILQQVFIVEFTVNSQMCDDCHRTEAKDFWRALVQIRQKTSHKKTFFYLEQLIMKHRVHTNALNVTAKHDGLNFYYSAKDHARKLVDFLLGVVPCRYQTSQQLISHDVHSNTFNYKNTFSVEIVPICKDEVVCLPLKLAKSLGSIGQLCICARVTSTIHLIDPCSGQVAEITGAMFWREPFGSVCGPKQLVEYIIMNVELIHERDRPRFRGQGSISEKHALADVWLVKSHELGLTNNCQHCRTHLAYILKPGDTVLGFDVANSNVNDKNFDKMRTESLPSIIIVKKLYSDKATRQRKRKWMLKHLNAETEDVANALDKDYTDFLEDLEEDPAYRQNISIYKDKNKIPVDLDETDDEDLPRITLQEMMDDLQISDDAAIEENEAQMIA